MWNTVFWISVQIFDNRLLLSSSLEWQLVHLPLLVGCLGLHGSQAQLFVAEVVQGRAVEGHNLLASFQLVDIRQLKNRQHQRLEGISMFLIHSNNVNWQVINVSVTAIKI